MSNLSLALLLLTIFSSLLTLKKGVHHFSSTENRRLHQFEKQWNKGRLP